MVIRRDLNRPGESHQVNRVNLSPEVSHFNFIQRKIHRIWGGTKAKISLLYIECTLPPNLKANREKLFYFVVGGKRHYSTLRSFEMDSRGNDIPIGIDLSQIEDVNDQLAEFIVGKNVMLKYRVLWRDEKGSNHLIDEEELELEITPLHCGSCKLGETNALRGSAEDDKISIEHNISKTREKLWELVFDHPGHLQFSNPVDSQISLRVEEDGKEIKGKFLLEGEFGEGPGYSIHKLMKDQKTSVFISIDYDRFKNPPQSRDLKVFVDETQTRQGKEIVIQNLFSGELTVNPDSAITQLGIAVQYEEENLVEDIRKKSSQTKKISDPIKWAIGVEHKTDILLLELWNSAQNPDPPGQIDIKDFRLDFELQDENGKMVSRKEYLEDYSESSPRFNIPNGGEAMAIDLSIHSANIHKAIADETPGHILIRFSYREKQPAKNWDSGEKEVNLKIEFTLKRYVEKWLALDFGTCAIASAIYDYNFSGLDNVELLDLNEVHRKLWKEADLEFEEAGTEFLSSVMYLDVKESGNAEQNNSVISLSPDVVKFSPSSDIRKEVGFLSRMLPNIKMLMGYDHVPLSYLTNMKAIKINSKSHKKLPVHIIVEAAYKHLFKDYICKAIINLYSSLAGQALSLELLKTFGNIVVTVPNTFNQSHLQTLKKMIREHLTWALIPEECKKKIEDRNTPLFFKDKIEFVSESDAVACYYLKRWSQFNPQKEESPPVEYLLIYDIGAGTVDISYQKVIRRFNDDGEEIGLKIEDLGKIGAIKAGNSLDTVLTRIIDIHAKLKEIELNYDIFSAKRENLADFVYLRNFIKNIIKIDLSRIWNSKEKKSSLKYTGDDVIQTGIGAFQAFKSILNLELFQNNYLLNLFLDSITKDLIENLYNIVDKNHVKDSRLQVDKVIISGRTANFQPLQERLHDVLLERTTIGSDKNIVTVPESDLKTAVVLGALDKVTSYEFTEIETRDIDAFYGLLWKKKAFGAGEYSFKTLLEPGKKPEKNPQGPAKYDSRRKLYELDAGKINMTFAEKVSLVKSFTPSPEKSYGASRSEMTSKVLEIRKDALAIKEPSKVPVKLKYDEELMLRLRVKNKETDPTNINAYSLEQDITYEENSWPFNLMRHLAREQDDILKDIKEGSIPWISGSGPEEMVNEQPEEEEEEVFVKANANVSEENIKPKEEDDERLF